MEAVSEAWFLLHTIVDLCDVTCVQCGTSMKQLLSKPHPPQLAATAASQDGAARISLAQDAALCSTAYRKEASPLAGGIPALAKQLHLDAVRRGAREAMSALCTLGPPQRPPPTPPMTPAPPAEKPSSSSQTELREDCPGQWKLGVREGLVEDHLS